MTGCRIVTVVLVALMITAPSSTALAAEPVLYTINFVASGTVDGVPFTDEPLVFPGVTDTDTVAALVGADPAQLAQLLIALSYVAGFGLFIFSIIKLKAHKDNPQQVDISAEFTFQAPLTLPAVRDGALVTLTIDSILNNTLELRTRRRVFLKNRAFGP
jgi:hypothetical protein